MFNHTYFSQWQKDLVDPQKERDFARLIDCYEKRVRGYGYSLKTLSPFTGEPATNDLQ